MQKRREDMMEGIVAKFTVNGVHQQAAVRTSRPKLIIGLQRPELEIRSGSALSILAYRCMRERPSRSSMASPRRLTSYKAPYPPPTFVSRPLSFYCTRQLTNGPLPHRLARWPRFRAPHSPAAVPPPGLKIATDTAGMLGRSHSHWRKGGVDSGGHESAREPMEKMPRRGSVQDRPHCGVPG